MSRELYSIEKNSIKENRKYIIIQFDTLHDFLEILFCCLSVFTYYLPLKLKFSNNRIFYNKTHPCIHFELIVYLTYHFDNFHYLPIQCIKYNFVVKINYL